METVVVHKILCPLTGAVIFEQGSIVSVIAGNGHGLYKCVADGNRAWLSGESLEGDEALFPQSPL